MPAKSASAIGLSHQSMNPKIHQSNPGYPEQCQAAPLPPLPIPPTKIIVIWGFKFNLSLFGPEDKPASEAETN